MKIADGRADFYQWDRQQRILADDYTSNTELHIALIPNHIYSAVGNDNLTALLTRTYTEDGHIYADIPDHLLQMAGTLRIYVYVRTPTTAHTVVYYNFKVIPRPRPADYIYTEAEQKEWDDLFAQLVHPVEATEEMTSPVGADENGKLWTIPTPIDHQLSIYSHNPIANAAVAGFAASVEDTFEEIGEILENFEAQLSGIEERLRQYMKSYLDQYIADALGGDY